MMDDMKMAIRILVLFIGALSAIGILYTFGWEAFSLKAVGLRGIGVFFMCLLAIVWSLFTSYGQEKETM